MLSRKILSRVIPDGSSDMLSAGREDHVMSSDDQLSRPRRGPVPRAARGVRRGLRALVEAIDVIYFLTVVGRLIALPFRLIARAFDSFP